MLMTGLQENTPLYAGPRLAFIEVTLTTVRQLLSGRPDAATDTDLLLGGHEMNDEPDRRRSDTEAARRRRQAQQHSWERWQATGSDHLSEGFAEALEALIETSGRLPVCDRSAKLFAALTKLAGAADQAAACAAARRLVSASSLALAEDPWDRFHRAAMQAEATLCATV